MVSFRGHRYVLAVVFSLLAAVPAAAQSSISFSGGGSIDPEQVYAGVAWQSPDIAGNFRVRPGIDGGFGEGLRLATINIDFLVKIPLGTSAWSLIQGGGPVISIAKFTDFEDFTDVGAGGSYVLGFAHQNGFFSELRIGGGGFTPQLKAGVGWAVEIK